MFLQVRRPNQQYQSNEGTKNTQITNNTLSKQTKTQQIPEGMVAKPERRWGSTNHPTFSPQLKHWYTYTEFTGFSKQTQSYHVKQLYDPTRPTSKVTSQVDSMMFSTSLCD